MKKVTSFLLLIILCGVMNVSNASTVTDWNGIYKRYTDNKDVINSLSIEEITKWIDICNKYQTYANTESTKQQTPQTPTMGAGGMIVSPLPS